MKKYLIFIVILMFFSIPVFAKEPINILINMFSYNLTSWINSTDMNATGGFFNIGANWSYFSNYSNFSNYSFYLNGYNASFFCPLNATACAGVELDPIFASNLSAYNISWSTTFNDSYVPYIGANKDVNLGLFNISTTGLGNFGNLNISGNSSFGGNLTPYPTLSNDIGSGVSRWNRLFVANISAEDIVVYNLLATDNITATTFIGNGSLLTGIIGSGNTTAEMRTAINNSGYYNITSQQCFYVNNASERTYWYNQTTQTLGFLITNPWNYFDSCVDTDACGYWDACIDAYACGWLTTESDPFWYANYTAYNASWSSTFNSTYNTWAYNQTTPTITFGNLYYINQSLNSSLNVSRANFSNYTTYWGSYSTPLTAWNDTYNSTYDTWIGNLTSYNASWSNTANSSYLLKAGDTMTGNLTFGMNMGTIMNGNYTYNNGTCIITYGRTSTFEVC